MPRLRLVLLVMASVVLSACDSTEPEETLGPLQIGQSDIELSGAVVFEERGEFNTASDRLIGGISYLFLSAQDEEDNDVFVYLYLDGAEGFAPGTYSVCSLGTLQECLESGPQSVYASMDVQEGAGGVEFAPHSGTVMIERVTENEVAGRFDIAMSAGARQVDARGEFRARRR